MTQVTDDIRPTRWLHRRTPVDAMRYDGTERIRGEIASWVAHHGGSADLRFDGSLLVLTPVKWARVPEEWWVVRGYRGQFFVIDNAVFMGCYDYAEGPDYNAILTREQAAAVVVAVDEMIDAGRNGQAVDLNQIAVWVRSLAATAEALR